MHVVFCVSESGLQHVYNGKEIPIPATAFCWGQKWDEFLPPTVAIGHTWTKGHFPHKCLIWHMVGTFCIGA